MRVEAERVTGYGSGDRKVYAVYPNGAAILFQESWGGAQEPIFLTNITALLPQSKMNAAGVAKSPASGIQ